MTFGEVTVIGAYTMRLSMRPDNPAWPQYLIFKGEKLIGKQFSYPCESDCKFHDFKAGLYAKPDESQQDFRRYDNPRLRGQARRGRPTNAERELRAALLLTEIPE